MNAAAAAIELHKAVDQCEEGEVGALADALAGVVLGAALADQYAAGRDHLTAKFLDAQALAHAVAAIANTALTFLVCHKSIL